MQIGYNLTLSNAIVSLGAIQLTNKSTARVAISGIFNGLMKQELDSLQISYFPKVGTRAEF